MKREVFCWIALALVFLFGCEGPLENWPSDTWSNELPPIYVHFVGRSRGWTSEGFPYWRVSVSSGSTLLTKVVICVRVCRDSIISEIGEKVVVVDSSMVVFQPSSGSTIDGTQDFVFERISRLQPTDKLSPCVESASSYGAPVLLEAIDFSGERLLTLCLGK